MTSRSEELPAPLLAAKLTVLLGTQRLCLLQRLRVGQVGVGSVYLGPRGLSQGGKASADSVPGHDLELVGLTPLSHLCMGALRFQPRAVSCWCLALASSLSPGPCLGLC